MGNGIGLDRGFRTKRVLHADRCESVHQKAFSNPEPF